MKRDCSLMPYVQLQQQNLTSTLTQEIQNEQAEQCANSSNYPLTASDRILIERLSGSPYPLR
jgi:hypothetical protein